VNDFLEIFHRIRKSIGAGKKKLWITNPEELIKLRS
jgi:hypothetical protein